MPSAPALEPLQRAQAVSVDSVLDASAQSSPSIEAPVLFDGPLSFLGYQVLPADGGIAVETWWKVEERTTRPLSIMAHLVDAGGVHVAVADGLGVPVESWQPGDVIVQLHHFAGFEDSEVEKEALRMVTGVYWLDTMEQHPVADDAGMDTLLLPLTSAKGSGPD
jgi:hypothetical protein